MVRFLDNDKVLIQGYYESDSKNFKRKFFGALEQYGIGYEKLIFSEDSDDGVIWAYLNFLQTRNLIVVPALGIEEDQQAFDQIRNFFPEYAKRDAIRQISMREIVETGGGMNCLTWTRKV